MEIELYDKIKEGLKNHIDSLALEFPYKPKPKTKGGEVEMVVEYEPSSPNYPYIQIVEVGNSPYQNMSHIRQTVRDMSYRVDIYAKTQNGVLKSKIARTLMKHCDEYLTFIGLKQISMNPFTNDGTNGELYHIVLMYSARYFENKQYFV